MLKKIINTSIFLLSSLYIGSAISAPSMSTTLYNAYKNPGKFFQCPTASERRIDPLKVGDKYLGIAIYPQAFMEVLGETTPFDALYPGDGLSGTPINERLAITSQLKAPYPVNSWIANIVWNRTVANNPLGEVGAGVYTHEPFAFGSCRESFDGQGNLQGYTRLNYMLNAPAAAYPYPFTLMVQMHQADIDAKVYPPASRGLHLGNAIKPWTDLSTKIEPFKTYKVMESASETSGLILSVAGNPPATEETQDGKQVFIILPETFDYKKVPVEALVDRVSDFSADVLLPYKDDSEEKKLTVTSTQGSPFLYVRAYNGANPSFTYSASDSTTDPNIRGHKWFVGNKPVELGPCENPTDPNCYNATFKTNENYPEYGYAILGIAKGKNDGYQYYGIFAPKGSKWFLSKMIQVDKDGKLDPASYLPRDSISLAKFPNQTVDDHTYFSIAALPPSFNQKGGEDADAHKARIEKALIDDYLPYAFNFITDTKVTPDVTTEGDKRVVRTAFEASATNVSTGTTGADTLMGIFPHQYMNLLPEYKTNLITDPQIRYPTVRGTINLLKGKQFKTSMTYPGILPWLPSLPKTDTEGITMQRELAEKFQDYGTYFNLEGSGIDTYGEGKRLGRLSQAINVMYDIWSEGKANDLLNNKLTKTISRYFQPPAEQCIDSDRVVYFYKNGIANDPINTKRMLDTVIGYFDVCEGKPPVFPIAENASYGLDRLNDHPFHYGYFINAAGQIGLKELGEDWTIKHKDVMNQLLRDIAYVPGLFPKDDAEVGTGTFPHRNWDPYLGYTRTSGMDQNILGPNMESSSEAVNAYAGLILWGQALEALGKKTNNAAMTAQGEKITKTGIYIYTTMINSIWHYWFDNDYDGKSYFLDQYKKAYSGDNPHSYASRIFDGGYDGIVFWDTDPLQARMINVLPLTGASFYLGKYSDQVKANYDVLYKYFGDFAQSAGEPRTGNLNPNYYRWWGLTHQYNMLGDNYGDNGQAIFDDWKKGHDEIYTLYKDKNKGVDYPYSGQSELYLYTWLRTFMNYGQPNFDVTTKDAVFYAVFKKKNKDGVMENTYVIYNPYPTPMTGKFSDGQEFKDIPAHSMWMYPDNRAGITDEIIWDFPHFSAEQQKEPAYSATVKWTQNAKLKSTGSTEGIKYKLYVYPDTAKGGISDGNKEPLVCEGDTCHQVFTSLQDGDYNAVIEAYDENFSAEPVKKATVFNITKLQFDSSNIIALGYDNKSNTLTTVWSPVKLLGAEKPDKDRFTYKLEFFQCENENCDPSKHLVNDNEDNLQCDLDQKTCSIDHIFKEKLIDDTTYKVQLLVIDKEKLDNPATFSLFTVSDTTLPYIRWDSYISHTALGNEGRAEWMKATLENTDASHDVDYEVSLVVPKGNTEEKSVLPYVCFDDYCRADFKDLDVGDHYIEVKAFDKQNPDVFEVKRSERMPIARFWNREVKFEAGETKIKLDWIKPKATNVNYHITVSQVGGGLIGHYTPKLIADGNITTETIEGLKPSNDPANNNKTMEYVVKLEAFSGGAKLGQWERVIKTRDLDQPITWSEKIEVPDNEKTKDSAVIHWDRAYAGNSKMTYDISVMDEANKIIFQQQNITNNYVTATGLKEGVEYMITLIAKPNDSFTNWKPRTKTGVKFNLGGAPEHNFVWDGDLTIGNKGDTSFEVSWSEASIDGDKTRITYDMNITPKPAEAQIGLCDTTTVHTCRKVTGLVDGTYDVSVKASDNKNVLPAKTKEKKGIQVENTAPLAWAKDVVVTERNIDSFTLTWSPATGKDSDDLNYVIYYYIQKDGDSTEKMVTASKTGGKITGLTPDTTYFLKVILYKGEVKPANLFARWDKGDWKTTSNKFSWDNTTSITYTPAAQTITLDWSKTTTTGATGDIEYTITGVAEDTAKDSATHRIKTSNKSGVLGSIVRLVPDTLYDVTVEAKDEAGNTEQWQQKGIKTLPEKVFRWDATSVEHKETTVEIDLTWTPAVDAEPNSNVTYEISWNGKSSITSDTHYVIKNLQPDTDYNVKIVARENQEAAVDTYEETIHLMGCTALVAPSISFKRIRGGEGLLQFISYAKEGSGEYAYTLYLNTGKTIPVTGTTFVSIPARGVVTGYVIAVDKITNCEAKSNTSS